MGTWNEYSKLVLAEIERLDESVKETKDEIQNLRVSLAVHEEKIGRAGSFYGAVSGMVVAIITAVVINYVIAPIEPKHPKVIYKEKTKNEKTLPTLD